MNKTLELAQDYLEWSEQQNREITVANYNYYLKQQTEYISEDRKNAAFITALALYYENKSNR